MAAHLYLIRCLDTKTLATIPGVLIDAGVWKGLSDCAGQFAPTLGEGQYTVTFTKAGYAPRTLVWNLADPPIDPILVGLEASFPSAPTRDQVCNVFCGFQGITVHTTQYGDIPAFGPETSSLNDADLVSYCQQMKAFGFTHVEFDISWQYVEADYQYPVPGRDLSKNLPEVCRRIYLIVSQGLFVKFAMAGDGLSVGTPPYGYNDPQGWTYGYEWLLGFQPALIAALSAYNSVDLTRYVLFVPGYDGCFYGWSPAGGENPDQQPERVVRWGRSLRALKPDLYIGLEHTPGNIPVGEGDADWQIGGRMDWCDTLFSEFDPFALNSDKTWQIVGRFGQPYHRPPDQPAGDDPNPANYRHDCSRGKRFYVMYELLTYLWVRGHISVEGCNQWFDYFRAMSPGSSLCMVRQ